MVGNAHPTKMALLNYNMNAISRDAINRVSTNILVVQQTNFISKFSNATKIALLQLVQDVSKSTS